jgi:hypothetical protein
MVCRHGSARCPGLRGEDDLMVRGWRRGTALACAGVLIFLALALGGAVIPRAANADSLDTAALTSQKALVTSALQKVAATLGYQYEEDHGARFDVYDLAGATANMDIYMPPETGDADEAGLLVIQFPDSQSATSFPTSGSFWPTGSETVTIGGHQATVSRDFNESGRLASSKIGWICGVHTNLVVLGFYYMVTTNPAGSTAARDKLVHTGYLRPR